MNCIEADEQTNNNVRDENEIDLHENEQLRCAAAVVYESWHVESTKN